MLLMKVTFGLIQKAVALYIWYININDQGQWVDASPDGGGDADGSDFVSKVDTASQNIVSDLTLGTDKITLNATAGSAEFCWWCY